MFLQYFFWVGSICRCGEISGWYFTVIEVFGKIDFTFRISRDVLHFCEGAKLCRYQVLETLPSPVRRMPPLDVSVEDVVGDLIQPLLQRQFLRLASVLLVGFEDGCVQDVVAGVNRGCDLQAEVRNFQATLYVCLERIKQRENMGEEFSFASR